MRILFIPTADSVSDLMLAFAELGHDVSYIPDFQVNPVAPCENDYSTIKAAQILSFFQNVHDGR